MPSPPRRPSPNRPRFAAPGRGGPPGRSGSAPSSARPAPEGPRRALSAQRAGGRIHRAGEPSLSLKLARALDVSWDDDRQLTRYTHGIHSYPARMHPLTARRALGALVTAPGQRVVDPFAGSGTVLVEAMLTGAHAFGVDANPLAVLLARARTLRAAPPRRRELVAAAARVSQLTLEEGKAARRSGYEPPPEREPPHGMTREERDALLEGWFAPHVRRELETLVGAIADEPDDELRDVLYALVSSVVTKVSKRESDTSGERVQRKLARGMAARLLVERAEMLATGLAALDTEAPAGARAEVTLGDARSLPYAPASIHAVVTSPPYAGTYDYVDHHALRLALLGLPAGDFAARELGARRGFGAAPGLIRAALARYEKDLQQVLLQLERILVPGGRAALLVGDSVAGRGPGAVPVAADGLVAELAGRVGLRVVAAAGQERPLLGTAERTLFNQRGKLEHLMVLAKP